MARWLIRFGYDGAGFQGWARQPGRRTVEGVILQRLRAWGWAPTGGRPTLEVASRTDRGVSARANALALSSELEGPAILRAMNGISPEICFTAAAPISTAFGVRRAIRRTYRYFEPIGSADPELRTRTGTLFTGSIDVRSFGRQLPGDRPVFREVESVRSWRTGTMLVTEVRAPAFVWGMVRKIVAALRELEADRLSLERLTAAIHGRTRLTLPLAEPEPLVLWDVEYPLVWDLRWTGPNRAQSRWIAAARAAALSRGQVLDSFMPEPVEYVGPR